MAHYDCNNCGASLGIAFGKCEACTPKEVFHAEQALSAELRKAETEWNEKTAELRRQFIAGKTAMAWQFYNDTWNRHCPPHLRKP